MVRGRVLVRRAVRLVVAASVGFLVALLVPRRRWRSRRRELPSGPWPPLPPSDGQPDGGVSAG